MYTVRHQNFEKRINQKANLLFKISVDLIIQNVGELEETLKRLQNHKGVTGVIVIDGKVKASPGE